VGKAVVTYTRTRKGDLELTIDFFSADWDDDEAYCQTLVDALVRGVEHGPGRELELPDAFLSSIDRIMKRSRRHPGRPPARQTLSRHRV
jgi:hypothetical protein